jgi:hypothetical protein
VAQRPPGDDCVAADGGAVARLYIQCLTKLTLPERAAHGAPMSENQLSADPNATTGIEEPPRSPIKLLIIIAALLIGILVLGSLDY